MVGRVDEETQDGTLNVFLEDETQRNLCLCFADILVITELLSTTQTVSPGVFKDRNQGTVSSSHPKIESNTVRNK